VSRCARVMWSLEPPNLHNGEVERRRLRDTGTSKITWIELTRRWCMHNPHGAHFKRPLCTPDSDAARTMIVFVYAARAT
jgi:hypothetical protein